ncbi:MAG: nitrate/nitrite transporter NrtS [Erythrobacter sp.]|uniref:nitrate/nitrite transporter NrtS n=1 Tax=Erythrobacter sp. TaxID=1042 RepID=UPI00261293E4|nr:nitrate/nitrite transporter NrtS [Erythrobacter sp.]MDJ0979716.1 nitrate/nitrite transporter NrtS [Erythrobacter sp.]
MTSRTFLSAITAQVTVTRAAKVGLVVGTLLVALNHADTILAGQWPAWWKIILTYMVPYSVSSYSTAMFIMEADRKGLIVPVEEPS